MAAKKYFDLSIEIDYANGQIYPVRFQSDAGEGHGNMCFPYTPELLEKRVDSLTKFLYEQTLGSRKHFEMFGDELMKALFFNDLYVNFSECLQRARSAGGGVRIRLKIRPPELERVPWEFLFDKRKRQFLVLDRNTPIVRDPPINRDRRRLGIDDKRIRILAMFANPKGSQALDVEAEKKNLGNALANIRARRKFILDWADGETVEVLQDHLQEKEYHIFHFIGHGAYRPENGQGEVEFSRADGTGHPLTAAQLTDLLGSHDSLRLVVLNACEGAVGSTYEYFSSVAASLVDRGIPCVIGMRFEIHDKLAIYFAKKFYRSLVHHLPIDCAVIEGRLAMRQQFLNSEWGSPIQYLRAPDDVLLPKRQGITISFTLSITLLIIIVLGTVRIRYLLYEPTQPSAFLMPEQVGFGQNTITALGVDPINLDDLWVASEDKSVYFNNLDDTTLRFPSIVQTILPRDIDDSCTEHDIFFGTWGSGLWVYSSEEKELTQVATDDELSDNHVAAMICAGSNELWVGTSEGLDRWLLTEHRWEHFDLALLEWRDEKPSDEYTVRDLALDPLTGMIWVLTRDSLFQPELPRILRLEGSGRRIPIVPSLSAVCFSESGQPVLGNDKGQVVINSKNIDSEPDNDGVWDNLSSEIGPRSHIWDLACLPKNRIIATSDNGIWVYNGDWTPFLRDIVFYSVILQDNSILMASSNGVYRSSLSGFD